ncbi:glutamine amidotransferase-related protein [Tatumella citrea]|uniref:CTP synthase (glutamine hydrolyzing) n=1 Tax=Tatumella citrea TaxID=53336 RepID=A0A1Y0LF45_TATCI|nr:CTP synthase [Tatumella citrea]ARU92675.1 CTP synthase [Tatumella citrea]ARU96711.1 CTP synthase [Tatumella citrea]
MLPFFILDDSPFPACFGVTASLWASQLNLPLWSLRPAFEQPFADSHQHVISAGYCVTSGLYRSNTLQQEVTDIAQLPDRDAVIVLAASQEALIASLPGPRLYSHYRDGQLILDGAQPPLTFSASPDRYGRYDAKPATAMATSPLTIAIAGHEADHRHAYPATLAALGDAADALGLSVDIRFVPPDSLSAELSELAPLSGIILPGGASMAAVIGQIRIAEATLNTPLPVLGLCLGMQSMATALVRQSAGCRQAILAEVDPEAPLHSFIRFDDGRHRCGIFPFSTPDGSYPMHYNHRYRFNPALTGPLTATGASITAASGDIIEGIALVKAPFWQGVQGHPELLSRPEAPHPLFIAFLQAAVNRQG